MKKTTCEAVTGKEKEFTLLVETWDFKVYPVAYSAIEFVTVSAMSIGQAIYKAKQKVGFNNFFGCRKVYTN